ncbi:MAG: MATE family efflux transporter [Deltaproteobacteria bacterium]|nr:MATE family efflux transporter [Deltaproteobacteria bacterium]
MSVVVREDAGDRGGSEPRALMMLALPLALQQLGFQLMGTVDAAWLGRYDDTALAAAGVGNNLLFAITSIGLGLVMGLDTVIPQAIGAGRYPEARRYLHAGLRLAVLVGLGCTLLVMATPLVLRITDIPEEVASDARVYVYLRALGVVPFLLSVALRSYLAAHNVTRPLIIAVVLGNIANAGLDYVLIFGVEAIGLPPLGVIGAALATVSVQIVIVWVYLASVRALDPDGAVGPLNPGDKSPLPTSTRADLADILKYGGPVAGQLFAEVGIFGVATVIAAHMGTLPAAGHTIALNLSSFTFSVTVGIGAATSVRVGKAIGAGDYALARRRGVMGLVVGLGVMAVFAAMFVIAPSLLANIFTDDPVVIAAAVPLLMIAALFQLSDGAQAIAAGALRGLGDTRATLVGNLIGHYAIGLPISLALGFSAGMGARGLWLGLSAGLTVTAIYLVFRFLAGTRIRSESPR